jgi:RNA methyltransferase, TrmH family
MHITSRDNSLLRQARAVRDGKDDDLIFVEGLRLCQEVVHSQLPLKAIIVSEQFAQKSKATDFLAELTALSDKSPRVTTVSEHLLESISYTKTPQGVVVLASRPQASLDEFSDRQPPNPLIVVMHRINNPVNVGAILRTAEAAGATGAIATQQTSDPLSPKSLRGAMGSAFRLPIWFGPTYEQTVNWCKEQRLQTICAELHATRSHDAADWRRPSAVIMGPESAGLSNEEVTLAGDSVRIPMQGKAESLNVAVAAGILLYEAARQRSHVEI